MVGVAVVAFGVAAAGVAVGVRQAERPEALKLTATTHRPAPAPSAESEADVAARSKPGRDWKPSRRHPRKPKPTMSPTPPPSSTPKPKPTPTEEPTTPPAPEAGNPLSMTSGLYVDPDSQPMAWVRSHSGDSRASAIRSGIADVPMGRWFNGEGSDVSDAKAYVSAAAQRSQLPVLVAYNIPLRDCDSYSAGGAGSASAYRSWARGLAQAIGSRPAVVILEPDAIPGMDCLNASQQSERLELIGYAVDQFAGLSPNTWVYLDAGHADWTPAGTMASRLEAAHVGRARGFALNVSNYQSTERNVAYAKAVNAALGMSKHFVVDTSRNGRPSDGSDWCNPSGQRVGLTPREGGAPGLDLQLWVKIPGESDGDCGIGKGTYAGEFVPKIALQLLGA